MLWCSPARLSEGANISSQTEQIGNWDQKPQFRVGQFVLACYCGELCLSDAEVRGCGKFQIQKPHFARTKHILCNVDTLWLRLCHCTHKFSLVYSCRQQLHRDANLTTERNHWMQWSSENDVWSDSAWNAAVERQDLRSQFPRHERVGTAKRRVCHSAVKTRSVNRDTTRAKRENYFGTSCEKMYVFRWLFVKTKSVSKCLMPL